MRGMHHDGSKQASGEGQVSISREKKQQRRHEKNARLHAILVVWIVGIAEMTHEKTFATCSSKQRTDYVVVRHILIVNEEVPIR